MFNHYVLCSNELTHDKNTIFYNSYIINDLKSKGLIFDNVHYWSDGPSSQFKNQYNFTNLLLHQRDHSMPADWNFFTTLHGKGENYGASGDVKMLFGERFCRIKLLLEILSLSFLLSKKSFLILPLKVLNQMKYVMQQNTSLNTTRSILSTFIAHKNSITSPLKTRKLLIAS